MSKSAELSDWSAPRGKISNVIDGVTDYFVPKVMKNAAHKAEATAFLDWVRSGEVQDKLKDFGLEPVDTHE